MVFTKHIRLTLLASLLVLNATTGTATTSFNSTNNGLSINEQKSARKSEQRQFQDESEESDDLSDSSDNTNPTNGGSPHRSLMMHLHHGHDVPHQPAGGAVLHPPPHEPVNLAAHPTDKDGPEVHAVNGHAGEGHPEGHAAGGAAIATHHKKEDDEVNKLHGGCHNGMRSGKPDPKCKPSHHIIFVQEWIPALKLKNPKGLCWECSAANQLDDFNHHLKIEGYIPIGSNLHQSGSTKIPDKALYSIDRSVWWDERTGNQVYENTWKKYGMHTGLTPVEFFKEVQRLQRNHPTPNDMANEQKEKTIPSAQLRKYFGTDACLECAKPEKKKGQQIEFFTGVRYCHEVLNKHAIAKAVPYTKCGKCPAATQCSAAHILVPRVEIH